MNQCQSIGSNGLVCKLPAGHHHHEDEVGTLWDDGPRRQKPPYFASDSHSLQAGMFYGLLMKAGIRAFVEVDDDNNYMNEVVVYLDPDDADLKVKITVLPPV